VPPVDGAAFSTAATKRPGVADGPNLLSQSALRAFRREPKSRETS
jgi:hypothetical protein